MALSNECIKLLQNLVDQYSQSGQDDDDYGSILPLLKEFQVTVIENKKMHKDERVIAFLSNTAVIAKDSPTFNELHRSFLLSYQQQTQALDSMFAPELRIKSELDESWGAGLSKKATSQSLGHSLFFTELQLAVAHRAERMAEQRQAGINKFNFK